MSNELISLLKMAYKTWKDDPDPPIPLKTIKEYLALECVEVDDSE